MKPIDRFIRKRTCKNCYFMYRREVDGTRCTKCDNDETPHCGEAISLNGTCGGWSFRRLWRDRGRTVLRYVWRRIRAAVKGYTDLI